MLVVGLAAGGGVFGVGQWVGRVNSDRESFKDFVKEVREKLDKVEERIGEIFQRLQTQTTTRSSARRLTDLGKKISESLNAADWALQAVSDIKKFVPDINEMEPYDVQELCFRYVNTGVFSPTPEYEKRLKACAYENGIDLAQVRDVLAIELRDYILKKRERVE